MVLMWEREQNTYIYYVTFDKFCEKKKIWQSIAIESIYSSIKVLFRPTVTSAKCLSAKCRAVI